MSRRRVYIIGFLLGFVFLATVAMAGEREELYLKRAVLSERIEKIQAMYDTIPLIQKAIEDINKAIQALETKANPGGEKK